MPKATTKKRKERCRKLLQCLKVGPREVVWTDEVFTVEPKLSRKMDQAHAVHHKILAA